jgi:transposase-like protein
MRVIEMAYIEVTCPQCGGKKVRKQGKTPQEKQRFLCQEEGCGRSFIIDYSYNGHWPEIKEKIVDMAMNGSGIRDTARVLEVSPTTVIAELKKSIRIAKRKC